MNKSLKQYSGSKFCSDRLKYLLAASTYASEAISISLAYSGNPRIENQIRQRMTETLTDFSRTCTRTIPVIKIIQSAPTRPRRRHPFPQRSVPRPKP
jgi:hypothetical protein